MPALHPRPWHGGSQFTEGPRRPLDREQRARFRYLARLHRRAGRLTANAIAVAEAMLRRLSENGRLDPSHATLADDAACGERTVRRALAALRACGLVRWTMRLVRAGWRAEQTSNAYELMTTARAPIPAPRCGGQDGRATSFREIQVKTTPGLDLTEARAALARRRVAFEEKMLGNKAGRR